MEGLFVEQTKKADLAYLQQLAAKCLEHVQDFFPTKWKTRILNEFRPQIETIMLAKEMDEWEAAVHLYNGTKVNLEKIYFMAAVKDMVNEKSPLAFIK
jgi:hypothetical protein